MDTMVLRTQQWLNITYGQDPRYNVISEDGYTGWGTINALTRALQIELGITETADNFGAGTISKFKQYYPNGIVEQASGAPEEKNVYGIIQGSLWCKGYSTNAANITKHFYSGTGNAIKRLKSDMGFSSPGSHRHAKCNKSTAFHGSVCKSFCWNRLNSFYPTKTQSKI